MRTSIPGRRTAQVERLAVGSASALVGVGGEVGAAASRSVRALLATAVVEGRSLV